MADLETPRAPQPYVRKILAPINFLPAILGPEMAAPILRGRGKIAFFLRENLHAHRNSRFLGGGGWGFLGRSADFFCGREDFLV